MPLRAFLGPAVAVALVAAGTPAGAALGPGPASSPSTASVSLSSARAGARPVALTLTLTYEMQCGYPGPGPVVIRLPQQERVPARLAPAQVLVDGQPARTVAISGHTVTVGLAPRPQIMCESIGPGRLTILLTRAAGFGNPLRADSYTIAVTRRAAAFTAGFTIRPA